ncbi:MAG: ABC transporter permease [Flammeovirgaceae bacterium]|nr:ABC transporter permease [Flammeovirgaceae bacterium]|tara:strand:+ start:2571 stop:3218 length:648 start_codon:yes stop_codon:yes gene_type:complete
MRYIKILCILLLAFTATAGILFEVPRLPILNETIRVLYFHVPMWFTMIFILLLSSVNAYKFISTKNIKYDLISYNYAHVGVYFGIIGILTGMVWANYTWGTFWTNDPKLNGSAIGLLIYFGYFILRNSIEDESKKAKVSSVYSVFAFSMLIPLIFILPRLTDSLHPGNGGNPGFNVYDLNSQLRIVFYPAVIGFICLGLWIADIKYKLLKITNKR